MIIVVSQRVLGPTISIGPTVSGSLLLAALSVVEAPEVPVGVPGQVAFDTGTEAGSIVAWVRAEDAWTLVGTIATTAELATETAARIAGDQALQDQIDAINTDIGTLATQASLDVEIQARIDGDQNLQDQIDALEDVGADNLSATGTTYAAAALLTDANNVFETVVVGGTARLPGPGSSRVVVTVCDYDTANDLVVYPTTGDQIARLGISNPGTVYANGGTATFFTTDAVDANPRQWWVK